MIRIGKMRNYLHIEHGFTLIEILVVLTLMGVVGIVATQIFVIGIRSQAKNEVIKEVKQNGDYALSVMEGIIRNAADVQTSCSAGNVQKLVVQNQDGYTTEFDCSGTQISSNSGYPNPTPTVTYVLTSDKTEVSSCTMRVVCPTPPIDPKYVFIDYTLSQSGGASLPVEKKATIIYQSTISLRTYK